MNDSGKAYEEALEPPPILSEATAIKVGLAGSTLAAIAILAGVLFGPTPSEAWESVIAAGLSAMSLLVAGSVVSIQPRAANVWLTAAACSVLAHFGFPQSWDTFRLAAFVFFLVTVSTGVVLYLPYRWRLMAGSAFVLFHFSGIFIAVTSPQPAPLLTGYLWTTVFRPYLQFAYLNNAYQFYSPDPGPASELWFCIYYESRVNDPVKMEVLRQGSRGEPIRSTSGELLYELMVDERGELTGEPIYDAAGKYVFEEKRDAEGNVLKRPVFLDRDEQAQPDYLRTVQWIKIPKRYRDYKDPLGQSYYRRLSLTEQTVQSSGLSDLPLPAQAEVERRRRGVLQDYPLDVKDGLLATQYQAPRSDIMEIVLPAYARHVCAKTQRPDRAVESVRIYRVRHNITPPALYVGDPDPTGNRFGTDLNDPTTYSPYYMGRFSPDGQLIDPADPMLYWLLPIRKNVSTKPEDLKPKFNHQRLTLADYKRLYEDFVYKHAGSHHMEGDLKE